MPRRAAQTSSAAFAGVKLCLNFSYVKLYKYILHNIHTASIELNLNEGVGDERSIKSEGLKIFENFPPYQFLLRTFGADIGKWNRAKLIIFVPC